MLKHLLAKVLRVLLNLAHSIMNAEKQSFPLLALLTFSHTGTRESEEVKIAFIAWVYLAALLFGLSVTVRELGQWSTRSVCVLCDCYCIQYNCVGVFVCHHVFANVCACALGAPQPNLTGDAETGTRGWSFLSETQASRYGGGTQPHRWTAETS